MSEGRKRAMLILGVLHIIDGVLLPIFYGLSWIFAFEIGSWTSTAAGPVWSGILFAIPAGILGIIAGAGNNRGVAQGALVMNTLSVIAQAVALYFTAAVTAADIADYASAGDIVVDVLTILLLLFEGIISIVAGVFSHRVSVEIALRSAQPGVVVYNTTNPGFQHPGQPAQGQYPGQQVQVQYYGQQAPAQYPAPQEQKY